MQYLWCARSQVRSIHAILMVCKVPGKEYTILMVKGWARSQVRSIHAILMVCKVPGKEYTILMVKGWARSQVRSIQYLGEGLD